MKPFYEHKGITIFHGDAREIPILAPFLITDPPYPNNGGWFTESVVAAREYLSRWRGETALVFWHELETPPVNAPLVAKHIWHRSNVNGKPYEPVYHFDWDGRKRRSEVKSAAAVFKGAGTGCDQYCGHPTQKNEYVMRWLVEMIPQAETVVDPFMGSGSTLIAAKDLGRKAIGIEIEERYCEIAAKRLQQEVFEFA